MQNNNPLNASNVPNPNPSSGVRTLNNMPTYFIVGIVIVILGGLLYSMSTRNSTEEAKAEKLKSVSQSGEAQVSSFIDGLEHKKNVPTVKKEEKPKVEHEKFVPTVKKEEKPTALNKKPELSEDEKRIKELALLKRKLYENAISSPTQIKVDAGNVIGRGDYPKQNSLYGNPSAPVSSLDLMKSLADGLSGGNQPQNNQDKNMPFFKAKNDFAYNGNKKIPLTSPYEVKTGTLIPAVMISGINSDLPGIVKGQVRENVFDTATGDYLLIPQGTTLIGKYSSNVSFGQNRALISWNRLVFPSGKTLDIGNMNGVDEAGYAGFEDEVDNHFVRIFGGAFLLSVLGGEIYFEDGKIKMANNGSLVQQNETMMQKTASQYIQKSLDIAPTIKIRSGYRFNIFVTRDLILEPLHEYSVFGEDKIYSTSSDYNGKNGVAPTSEIAEIE